MGWGQRAEVPHRRRRRTHIVDTSCFADSHIEYYRTLVPQLCVLHSRFFERHISGGHHMPCTFAVTGWNLFSRICYLYLSLVAPPFCCRLSIKTARVGWRPPSARKDARMPSRRPPSDKKSACCFASRCYHHLRRPRRKGVAQARRRPSSSPPRSFERR